MALGRSHLDFCVPLVLPGILKKYGPVPEKSNVDTKEQLHVPSFSQLATVLVTLLILTGITFGISHPYLGFFKVPFALAIACAMATFVLFIFMHLKYVKDESSIYLFSAG